MDKSLHTEKSVVTGWTFDNELIEFKINWPEDSVNDLKDKIKKLEEVNAGLTLEMQEYRERVEKLKADLEETYKLNQKLSRVVTAKNAQIDRLKYSVSVLGDKYNDLLRGVMTNGIEITDVKFNGPATIVFWSDGDKTVVKAGENDYIDYEKGLAMAIVKKKFGTNKSKGNYYDLFRKWLPKEEEMTTLRCNLGSLVEAVKIACDFMNPPIEDDKKEEDDLK